MALLEIRDVHRRFGALAALNGVSLDIGAGEFFTLLGPSGCGKTTLLRLIAGLDFPDSGAILLDGRDLVAVPPERRPVHTVFQSYALFPHLTVAGNIAFPLRMARVPAAEIAGRVERVLAQVQLAGLEQRYPRELSGGQRQRVAVARALVNRPRLLLLDEPLAALDLKLREEMRVELIALQKEVGITFVYVTHDQGEALALSDRVAVMNAGGVEQVGEPDEVYEFPGSRFVADFIGSCNLLDGTVEGNDAGGVQVRVEGLGLFTVAATAAPPLGLRGTIAVRPEKVRIATRIDPAGGENHVSGVVRDQVYLGDVTVYRVQVNHTALFEAMLPNSAAQAERFFDVGDRVELAWRSDASRFLVH